MPLYEYDCSGCGETFEKRVAAADADHTACPHYGSQQIKRRLSRVALQLQPVSRLSMADSGGTCSSGSCFGNCETD